MALLGCGTAELPEGTLCRRADTVDVLLDLSGCTEVVEEPVCTVTEVQGGDRVLDVSGATRDLAQCVASSVALVVPCGGGFEPGDVVVYGDRVTLFELLPDCER